MEQYQTKSIEQLLGMSDEELKAYLANLPEKERKQVVAEFMKAHSKKQAQALVDNLNRNLTK